MTLLQTVIELTGEWHSAFAQARTALRAQRHAVCTLCTLGRRTISRCIMSAQEQWRDWSSDYLLYSRSTWEAAQLFTPACRYTAAHSYPRHIAVAFDDTRLKKTGRNIPGAHWQRDPLSPPFHVNLVFGLRRLQAAALVPLHRFAGVAARGIPVAFDDAPVVKKPGKRATPEAWTAYHAQRRTVNLPLQLIAQVRRLRAAYNQLGAWDKLLVAVVDGSFCNRAVFRAVLERVVILARCRKDARLCRPAAPGSRRVYDKTTFTPDEVRRDESIPTHTGSFFYGGAWRTLRYKVVAPVLWRTGSGPRQLRVIVMLPVPYRQTHTGKLLYREPAYLLTTDLETPVELLIQMYCDRWEIEVNHRDEKDVLGVGQAQVRTPPSVERQPALVVAAYSVLLIAALMVHGPERTAAYEALPRWRRRARRASCLDMVTLLRKECVEHPDVLRTIGLHLDSDALMRAAAA